jgi:small subunit ribosomal protein S3
VGQKVNPVGFRTGVYRSWNSRWFPRGSTYAANFFEDIRIRDIIKRDFAAAEIDHIEIEKTGDMVRVVVFAARPGVLIGKKGQEIEGIRKKLATLLKRGNVEVSVQEIKQPELSANIVAQSIAEQLEKRASYKKAMKRAAAAAMRAGAKGIKIRVAGRLAGAEIARDEWIRVGSTPLHTLRADIDFGLTEALTTYGLIGVKVWICRGEYKAAKD